MWIELVPEVGVAEQRRHRLDVDDLAPVEREAGRVFIQALTEITISEPVKPAITIGMPLRKWARGESRSQP